MGFVTAYLKALHHQVDRYLSDYNAQKVLLVSLVVFLLVCIIATAMILRSYIVKAKLNEELARKNDELTLWAEKSPKDNETSFFKL